MKTARRGISLLEVMVAVVLVASLLSLTVRTVSSVGLQRREALRHTVAQQVLANRMEIITMQARTQPPATGSSTLPLAAANNALIRNGKLSRRVGLSEENDDLLRIELQLVWQTDAGNPAAERLVAWVARTIDEDASP